MCVALEKMKFAILGATGPTGLQLVDECLQNGHSVTALVRNPDKITVTHENLTVVQLDVCDEDSLVPQLRGKDAVLSCLGGLPGIWTPCSIYTDSVKPLTSAMRKAGVKRFVGMTAWGTKYDPGLKWIIKWVLRPLFLRNVLANMSDMEDFLTDQCPDIDFTIVRPPGLNDLQSTGLEVATSQGQYVPGGSRICRRDVAKFMLRCVVNEEWKRTCVAIGIKLPETE